VGIDGKLVGGGPFGAKGANVDRTIVIALDVYYFAISHGNNLAAANSTIRADTRDFLALFNRLRGSLGV
jgi:hypothetical protein